MIPRSPSPLSRSLPPRDSPLASAPASCIRIRTRPVFAPPHLASRSPVSVCLRLRLRLRTRIHGPTWTRPSHRHTARARRSLHPIQTPVPSRPLARSRPGPSFVPYVVVIVLVLSVRLAHARTAPRIVL
ncbi:hypothetical protein BD311DRAFT_765149 [Dichomitus squalens]|uniref:Uncharacterized protein n=1 Tax=Dichomitus squalens TaxID=114155 RepID=A0A4Q9MGX6_9APHY|nr:hypothetical protein BD311DRAFT_765149 [Dichomitus squalens]